MSPIGLEYLSGFATTAGLVSCLPPGVSMSLDGLVKVLILAVVQGIAEFLPISSLGHLVVLDKLYQRLFGDAESPRKTSS